MVAGQGGWLAYLTDMLDRSLSWHLTKLIPCTCLLTGGDGWLAAGWQADWLVWVTAGHQLGAGNRQACWGAAWPRKVSAGCLGGLACLVWVTASHQPGGWHVMHLTECYGWL